MHLADLDAFGAAAVYLVVIGFVFAECALLVGFFLPGDTLLFAGGLVAADAMRGVDVGWLMAGCWSRRSSARPSDTCSVPGWDCRCCSAAAAGW